jgi:hypothetical protein
VLFGRARFGDEFCKSVREPTSADEENAVLLFPEVSPSVVLVSAWVDFSTVGMTNSTGTLVERLSRSIYRLSFPYSSKVMLGSRSFIALG